MFKRISISYIEFKIPCLEVRVPYKSFHIKPNKNLEVTTILVYKICVPYTLVTSHPGASVISLVHPEMALYGCYGDKNSADFELARRR